MDILKTFVSDLRPYREWGLSKDGKLYSRFIGSESYGWTKRKWDWEMYEESTFAISFQEMRQIVNAFASLVSFL